MKTDIIGREAESKRLLTLYQSTKSEFITVYGRRRVGKTFLIKQYFEGQFTFETSGIIDGSKEMQFFTFFNSLQKYGFEGNPPKNWMEAFDDLAQLIEKSNRKRKVIFLDEIPCFDIPKTNFVKALGYFWNSFAADRRDILLIVCGSATSWIVGNIIDNHGGLHNRTTGNIYLQQFSLAETEQFLKYKHIQWPRKMIAEAYMVFGGIPYYLNLLDKQLTLAANIDSLYFNTSGELHREYRQLYNSLFRNPEPYMKIIETLAKSKSGLTRTDIATATKLPQNGKLTQILEDLEQSNLIRCFYGKSRGKVKKRDAYYQLIDLFTLFHLTFSQKAQNNTFWQDRQKTSVLNTWNGLAFERICLWHIDQIRNALGLNRVAVEYYSWRSRTSEPNAQIDLIIERADKIVNICEIKFADGPFTISKEDDMAMRNRIESFRTESGTNCAPIPVWITTFGLKQNTYSADVQYEVTLDDLFK